MRRAAVDDERIMARVRQGDREALEMLVRRYATQLLTFLHRMMADRSEAEDVFQEVWIAIWLKRRSFDTTRRFRPWMYRIAANRCSDFRRRRRPHLSSAACGLAEVLNTCDADDSLMRHETLQAVEDAIRGLPPAQREVVTLRVYASLTYGEIADVLETSETTARSHMSLALKSLRQRLQPLVESCPPEELHDDHAPTRREYPRHD